MRYRRTKLSSNIQEEGFTIIELMIASLVFSVILIVITVGVLKFTSAYYKGINSSSIQNTTQAAMDSIVQDIQFSGAQIVDTPDVSPGLSGQFCAGGNIYVYTLGVELQGSPTATNAGLYRAKDTSASCNTYSGSFTDGTELLGQKMRLSDLHVTSLGGTDNVWSVGMHVVFGDDDLLVSPTSHTNAAQQKDATCGAQTGSQFCSIANLSTTAQKRVD